MGVELLVDLESISLRSAGPATGCIAVNLGGEFFPSARWNDFVVVIVEAWASALLRLLRRSSDVERVHFMEGPYAIEIERIENGQLRLRAIAHPNRVRAYADVSSTGLAKALLTVGQGVLQKCRRGGYANRDVERLADALASLHEEVLSSIN